MLSEAHERVVEKVKKDPDYINRLREMLALEQTKGLPGGGGEAGASGERRGRGRTGEGGRGGGPQPELLLIRSANRTM